MPLSINRTHLRHQEANSHSDAQLVQGPLDLLSTAAAQLQSHIGQRVSHMTCAVLNIQGVGLIEAPSLLQWQRIAVACAPLGANQYDNAEGEESQAPRPQTGRASGWSKGLTSYSAVGRKMRRSAL
jgi:hypothetical protein